MYFMTIRVLKLPPTSSSLAKWRFFSTNLLKIPELWLSTFPSKKAPNPPFCQTAC